MTRGTAAALAAGALAVGILIGASGTIVVGDLANPGPESWDRHMGHMRSTGAGMAGMSWMMGDGWDADAMRDLHAQHHGGQR